VPKFCLVGSTAVVVSASGECWSSLLPGTSMVAVAGAEEVGLVAVGCVAGFERAWVGCG